MQYCTNLEFVKENDLVQSQVQAVEGELAVATT